MCKQWIVAHPHISVLDGSGSIYYAYWKNALDPSKLNWTCPKKLDLNKINKRTEVSLSAFMHHYFKVSKILWPSQKTQTVRNLCLKLPYFVIPSVICSSRVLSFNLLFCSVQFFFHSLVIMPRKKNQRNADEKIHRLQTYKNLSNHSVAVSKSGGRTL